MDNTVKTYITQNGDTATWTVEISNPSLTRDCHNAIFTLTIPAGVSLTGPAVDASTEIAVSQGVYSNSLKTWYIGSIPKNSTISTQFIFTVNDISLIDSLNGWFQIDGVLLSDCIADDCENEIHLLMIEGEACNEVDISVGEEEADYEGGLNISVS